MAALYARSHETEEHGKRLTCLTRMIGEVMGLDVNMLDDLMLLSMLHDIGESRRGRPDFEQTRSAGS